jgi:hypothetical protein
MDNELGDLIPEPLLIALESRFKPQVMAPGFDRDKLMFESGRISMVQFLRERFTLAQKRNKERASNPGFSTS